MDRNAKKGQNIWMNTFCAFHVWQYPQTTHCIESNRSLDSICNRHPMYFHFGIHHTNAMHWFIPLLTLSLTGFLFVYVCMHACKCTIQQPTIECLTYLHLQLFVRLVLCIDYLIVVLFVTCNTYAKTQSHTHIYIYIHTQVV